MRGPYQIRKEREGEGYLYKLIKYKGGKAVLVLAQVSSTRIVPPPSLLVMQARLNTKAILDYPMQQGDNQ